MVYELIPYKTPFNQPGVLCFFFRTSMGSTSALTLGDTSKATSSKASKLRSSTATWWPAAETRHVVDVTWTTSSFRWYDDQMI